MSASDYCQRAAALIGGDRARVHGDARQLHESVARLWSEYMGHEHAHFTARDVLMMLALLKVARSQHGEYNADDYVDTLGYVALAAQIAFEDAQ